MGHNSNQKEQTKHVYYMLNTVAIYDWNILKTVEHMSYKDSLWLSDQPTDWPTGWLQCISENLVLKK